MQEMVADLVMREVRGAVGWVFLNRPDSLNALNEALMRQLGDAVRDFDADSGIGCLVLTGNGRAFAAGADIREMVDRTFPGVVRDDFITGTWEDTARVRKPVIAAVNGHALGGGCELAMMCDLVIASEEARFGQPEIRLGIIPGAGGTQRLTRAVGKAVAMDLILTGRMIDAAEALRIGLVSRVVAAGQLQDEVQAIATTIAGFSRTAATLAKEAVNHCAGMDLQAGIGFERRLFHALFGTEDQKEGMKAFIEKRKPRFRN